MNKRPQKGKHQQKGKQSWTPPHVAAQRPLPLDREMVITDAIFLQVAQRIGTRSPEQGGALGGPGHDRRGPVTRFEFDFSSYRTGATYSPDHDRLNWIFSNIWNPDDIYLRGFVHSHPGRYGQPSPGDLSYSERILNAIPELGQLYLPIVGSTAHNNAFEMRPFRVVIANGQVKAEPIPMRIRSTLPTEARVMPEQLVPDQDIYDRVLDQVRIPARHPSWRGAEWRSAPLLEIHSSSKPEASTATPPVLAELDPANAFDRVQEAYDLPLLSTSRMVVVGAGGAAAFLDDLARTGLGQLVLIDPDTIAAPNIGTQQVYLDDLGRPKVEVLAERLLRINPELIIETRQVELDELDDAAVYDLACEALDGEFPTQTILCGFTDNFPAQARMNRLALQFGLPSLCAQVYREGRGAEITFTHPEVTTACHRCALGNRYRWYLEQEHQNDVTSHQTPIFATTRLNALKGFIALAMLHHGSDHPRWGDLLERIGDRNLVQIRLDPDFAATMSIGVFDRTFERANRDRLFFDDVVWLAQEPECEETGYPACPECGGGGYLREAMGTFDDTRVMPGLEEERDAAIH